MAQSSNGDTVVAEVVEAPVPRAVPMSPPPIPGNEEFPVPCARFTRTLIGTHDEVWATHLRIQHGHENHTMPEWRALLEAHRHRPAHPDHPDFAG